MSCNTGPTFLLACSLPIQPGPSWQLSTTNSIRLTWFQFASKKSASESTSRRCCCSYPYGFRSSSPCTSCKSMSSGCLTGARIMASSSRRCLRSSSANRRGWFCWSSQLTARLRTSQRSFTTTRHFWIFSKPKMSSKALNCLCSRWRRKRT